MTPTPIMVKFGGGIGVYPTTILAFRTRYHYCHCFRTHCCTGRARMWVATLLSTGRKPWM